MAFHTTNWMQPQSNLCLCKFLGLCNLWNVFIWWTKHCVLNFVVLWCLLELAYPFLYTAVLWIRCEKVFCIICKWKGNGSRKWRKQQITHAWNVKRDCSGLLWPATSKTLYRLTSFDPSPIKLSWLKINFVLAQTKEKSVKFRIASRFSLYCFLQLHVQLLK